MKTTTPTPEEWTLAHEFAPEHNLALAMLELPEIVDQLRPGLFADPAVLALHEWLTGLRKRHATAPDVATRLGRLAEDNRGLYLIVLRWLADPQLLVVPENWPYWEGIVREKAAKRHASAVAKAIQEGDGDLSEHIAKLRAIEAAGSRAGPVAAAQIIDSALADMEDRYQSGSEFMGIDTGFPALNGKTDGLTKKALWVIAARPSVGKTTLGVNIVANVACTSKIPCAFFSLEMQAELIYQKLFHILGNVSQEARKRQMLTEGDFARLAQAATVVRDSPLHVVDWARTLQSITSEVRRLHDAASVRVVVIDYLQRVSIEGSKEDKWHDIGRVSNALKDVAMDTGVTVVALAQLSRATDKEEREPTLADLRGSAEIEADGDVVAFLWRKAGALQFTVGKSRMGQTGPIAIDADYDTGRMIQGREVPA